ncbi:hypothetical protein P5V15_009767 [Pogonomyrmex californicus]
MSYSSPRCIFIFNQFEPILLEALIFVVLVANFTASPGQIDYDTLAAGVFFTITTQNVFKIAAVVIVVLHTIVIVIVAAVATAVAAVATAANPTSKVSDQRQLR